jgi:hypothetical protein
MHRALAAVENAFRRTKKRRAGAIPTRRSSARFFFEASSPDGPA